MTNKVADDRLRVGIVGAGFMGEVHARAALSAGAEVVGMTSRTRASAEEAAARLRIPAYESLVDLLSLRPDVVHVCTPNATHASITAEALAAGTGVVCEKPLATRIEVARDLCEAAENAAVVSTVPFIYRYHPMVREARAMVRAGEVGQLLSVQASYLQDWMLHQADADWRMSEGSSRAFADIGSHLCDLVEFVASDRIVRLSARTRMVYSERAGLPVCNEDIAALVVEFTSGAIGTLLVSQMAAGRKNALTFELHGTQQMVRFEQENPDVLQIGTKDAVLLRHRDAVQLSADARRLSFVPPGHPMGYQDAFNAFVRDTYGAIRGTVAEGLPMFVDGLRAAVVTDAVVASAAQSGRWVTVES